MKLLKFFELYELGWSRIIHFRSGREATRGLEKKKKKKGKLLLELEWAIAYFLKLSHNTAGCIMAHSRLSRHAGQGAPGGGRDIARHAQDTAGHARDTTEEVCDTTRSARAAWPGEDAAIQSLYRELGNPWVAIQWDESRYGVALHRDTTWARQYGRGGL